MANKKRKKGKGVAVVLLCLVLLLGVAVGGYIILEPEILQSSDPVGDVLSGIDIKGFFSNLFSPAEEEQAPITDNGGTPVEVEQRVVRLGFNTLGLQTGATYTIIARVLNTDGSDRAEGMVYESMNTAIATVDANGVITGVAPGSTTVRVSAAAAECFFSEIAVTVTDTASSGALTYIDGTLIVNKEFSIPEDYGDGLSAETQAAFSSMQAAASGAGYYIWIASGYRSYYTQQVLYNRYVANYGQAEADTFSAQPGHSEHQTGLAIDLNSISDDFGDTPEGQWVAQNCHLYGFIIRYPAGKDSITGYQYEPWHIRYVGVELASAVYESGLTLEEYLGLTF